MNKFLFVAIVVAPKNQHIPVKIDSNFILEGVFVLHHGVSTAMQSKTLQKQGVRFVSCNTSCHLFLYYSQ